jgi:hypothetical protein
MTEGWRSLHLLMCQQPHPRSRTTSPRNGSPRVRRPMTPRPSKPPRKLEILTVLRECTRAWRVDERKILGLAVASLDKINGLADVDDVRDVLRAKQQHVVIQRRCLGRRHAPGRFRRTKGQCSWPSKTASISRDCRVGLAPTGKTPPCTAHTQSGQQRGRLLAKRLAFAACHRNGSSSSPKITVALSLVAGSGPRPSAKAASSIRAPCSSPGRA